MPETDVDEQALDLTKEVAIGLAKDVYADAGRPVAKPTGELVGLVPRAIRAALAPVEKWILQREYNMAETKKLLEEKLQNTPPELIQPPEPHIAVPALQYISYCMDNEELRDMYASLLANSMNSAVKNGVHPAFVEIVKQLSPDEAKVLRHIYYHDYYPILGLRTHKNDGRRLVALPILSNVAEVSGCENIHGDEGIINNLCRLGLVTIPEGECLIDKALYEPLKTNPFILEVKRILEKDPNFTKIDFVERFIKLTVFGNHFCSICIGKTPTGVG